MSAQKEGAGNLDSRSSGAASPATERNEADRSGAWLGALRAISIVLQLRHACTH